MGSEIHVLIAYLFQFLYIIILARVILSWVPLRPGDALYPAALVVFEITEPLFAPFRALIPPVGGIDFSCILLFLGLEMFQRTIFSILGS